MAAHLYQLYAVDFTEADQDRLADFNCGADDWSRHVAEWIRGTDVFESMKRGTRVWLFETRDGEVVGFGSLGATRWRWPPPDGGYTSILIIPMLGVAERFQGQPPDAEWKYARQIMGHLIAAARQSALESSAKSKTPTEWLVLLVHRDNARAIRFYEKCGFELIPDVERAGNHVVMKLWVGA